MFPDSADRLSHHYHSWQKEHLKCLHPKEMQICYFTLPVAARMPVRRREHNDSTGTSSQISQWCFPFRVSSILSGKNSNMKVSHLSVCWQQHCMEYIGILPQQSIPRYMSILKPTTENARRLVYSEEPAPFGQTPKNSFLEKSVYLRQALAKCLYYSECPILLKSRTSAFASDSYMQCRQSNRTRIALDCLSISALLAGKYHIEYDAEVLQHSKLLHFVALYGHCI